MLAPVFYLSLSSVWSLRFQPMEFLSANLHSLLWTGLTREVLSLYSLLRAQAPYCLPLEAVRVVAFCLRLMLCTLARRILCARLLVLILAYPRNGT